MPLKLVTGPANAAKAGEVLGGLRARLDEEPVLVVPSVEDVEHNQRELASRGVVFGARVLEFKAFFRLLARRTGTPGRVATDLQRRLAMAEAIGGARFEELAASAARPGFARAAERFVAELGRSMVEPAELAAALSRWAAGGSRRRYAAEVAWLYRRYRDRLEAAGLVDEELLAWRAVEALEGDPAAWGDAPVFLYGFDDFTPVELRALDVLRSRADVVVSLPYERGRRAFAAIEPIHDRLAAMAGEPVVELQALDTYYDEASRPPLHALERGLFEDAGRAAGPRAAVHLHTAGGERAEVELCAAEVLRLLRGGTPAGEIAVVFRDPGRYASLVEQVFGAYGIPYSADRGAPFAHTAVGRGLLALLRAACLDGSTDDLLAYLRTPGFLREPAHADRLESLARQKGVVGAAEARALWEGELGLFELDELDRLPRARGGGELAGELERRLERLFSAPYERRAHVLAGAELEDPQAFQAAGRALRQLAGAAVEVDAATVHEVLGSLPVRLGERVQPDRVQVASPEAIRARRFAAVFVCGLQEGEFPRAAAGDPFLSDSDRRALARLGVALPRREQTQERERYLFYVCASRAERRLVLSARYCDEEGDAERRSFFVDDVLEVLPELAGNERRRSLSDVTWDVGDAPTETEWDRAVALRGARRRPEPVGSLHEPGAVDEVAATTAVSASALERYASCPVRWLVEDVLRPERLEPDPEQMVRGSYAHRVLELTFRRLREETGSRRVTPETLPRAERILVEALEEERGTFRLAPTQTRVRAAVRRLELDLMRYLRHESTRDGLFEPEHLELRFGLPEAEHPEVELAGGLLVRGVIDRVDVWRDRALVRDYKGGRVESYKEADWERRNRFQAALYMLVVERLLGLRAAGAVYTPLGGSDRRSRGLVAAELIDELGGDFVATDVKPEDEFGERIEWAQRAIAEVAEGMRAGRLESCPDTCAWRGGCSYPAICRIES
jgi:ATP-dependent helicase/DNAse subunit B